ncbi:hypothetical protein [Candidatus Uabimicrobium sp. HlEnr_7]|uniref:hypothetical protein n=1 Tax=Candidatus Uabimicrobium helgolandensis TaxID=3095367 RepID=UPI0035592028
MMHGLIEYATIFLFVLWISNKIFTNLFIAILIGACSLYIPLGELTLAQYILSYHPSFSFSSCALCGLLVYHQSLDELLLTKKDMKYFLWGNVVLGTTLYLSSFAIIPFDIYFYGFFFSEWFVVFLVINLFCILLKYNTIFYILLGCIFSFLMHFGYSPNYFDYLIDPLLFLCCTGILIKNNVVEWFRKKNRSTSS